MNIQFGRTYSDVVTGFRGIAIGYTSYISGCAQVLLQPKCGKDGKRVEGEWFDEQRMREVPGTKTIVLDNSQTPGFDKAAPKR